ncbi:MAG: ECF transporter S component [Clostridiales bacterium]|nr:ECF transporter S component [Clostridiales bacterium]
MKKFSVHEKVPAKNLAFTALFAALCCIGTLIIAIPLPNGYFNMGDTFVLLSGWCLGPIYGSIAAGIGSVLADIISGYTLYALPTLFIKGVDALIAYMVWAFLKKIIKREELDFLPRSISALLGEAVMVVGYFLFELVLYGFGGAILALVGNLTQGVCSMICAVLVVSILYKMKATRNLFPSLK